jgi:hypothetical protein
LALALGAAAPAAASPLFELVGAPGGGGLNARVAGPSAASTYYNPALLAHATQQLEIGTFFLTEQISVTLDPRASSPQCQDGGCDVPEAYGAGPESFRHADGSALGSPGLPTRWLEEGVTGELDARPRQRAGTGQNTRFYQIIGLVNPIFGERLVVGVHAMIPMAEFTEARAFYNDEREQFFSNSLHPELYSDRMTATSLAFGCGGKVTERWSLGLSFTLNLKNRAAAPVYISNLADLNTVLLDSDIGVQASVSPHFGAVFDANDDLRLAATVHTRQALEIETGFDYVIATGVDQGTTVAFTHAYMPLTTALAGSYAVSDALALVGTASFARWSQYRDRHAERPHPDYAWRDTLSGSVGARYGGAALDAYLDLAYQPSPVPAQTGRSNYVDNDRLAATTGVESEFDLWGGTFQLGAQLQAHRLFYRHVTKFATPTNPQPNPNLTGFGDGYYPQLVIDEVPDDAVDGVLGEPIARREGLQTNNPGFPGFASEGWLLGASLNLSIVY